MPEILEQQEPYYSLHRSFTGRYRCRVARRLGVPAVTLAAYYAVMHDIASNAGTFGEFTTDVRSFEEAIGAPERHGTGSEDVRIDEALAANWRRMERARICDIIEGQPEPLEGFEGLPSEFRVRVLGVADVNAPRRAKPGRIRTAEWRARKRDERDGVTSQAAQTSHTSHENGVTARNGGFAGIVTGCDAQRHGDAEPTNQLRTSHMPSDASTPNPVERHIPSGSKLAAAIGHQLAADAQLLGSARRKRPGIRAVEAGERLHDGSMVAASVSGPAREAGNHAADALSTSTVLQSAFDDDRVAVDSSSPSEILSGSKRGAA